MNLIESTSTRIFALLIASILLAGCTSNPKPVIFIQPAETLVDQPVSIRLLGFKPEQKVMVRVTAYEDQYESHATFLADTHGEVDLARQAPLSGSYTTADGMGLFWSMVPKAISATPTTADLTPTTGQTPYEYPIRLSYLFSAVVDGQTVAQATAVRTIGLPGMTRTEVRENGLNGVLFIPPGDGPFPVVITLGGSGGGLETESRSLMLASHGYASLALVYFDRLGMGNSDFPARLNMIPLEYFGKAIQWLQSQARVDPNRIGIIGWSRGGEAALLVGATYPQIKAVISYSAYTVAAAGDSDTSQAVSSWSYQGQGVPFLADSWAEYQVIHPFLVAVSDGKDPLPLIPDLVKQMEATPAITSAAIPVEKIDGSILLISGLDDRLVPSTLYGEFAIHRLAVHHFAFPYRHLYFQGAGHGAGSFPYLPNVNDKRAPSGAWLGGTAQADASADAISWPVVLETLGMMK